MMFSWVLIFLVAQVVGGYGFNMPITGNTRPAQECPVTNDLVFDRCLSPCRSETCADLRKQPRSGTRPCVRMCVAGWACPRGQYLLDGYADVCVKKKACRKRKDVTACTYENATVPANTNFLKGALTCRCFVDGHVRCRNPFPEA